MRARDTGAPRLVLGHLPAHHFSVEALVLYGQVQGTLHLLFVLYPKIQQAGLAHSRPVIIMVSGSIPKRIDRQPSMDFSLTPEHEMTRRMVREFAEQEVAPVIKDHDRAQTVNLYALSRNDSRFTFYS